MNRAVLASALPVLLSGCTTLYPPLYSAPSVVAAYPNKSDPLAKKCREESVALTQTLACAEILQAVYSSGYKTSAQMQDISQLPIIGAAAAAAWILLKDKDNAARGAGKIGIGALTYSAARDQLLPTGLPDTFIKGHAALGCVIAHGGYFDGEGKEYKTELEREVANTYLLRVAVQKLRYLDPKPGDTSATPEMLKAARALADEAITQSAAQLETSQTQLGAFQFANVPFRSSVTNIAAWVASRGRTRPNASYDTLLGTFKPKAAAAAVRNGVETTDPGEQDLLADAEVTSWTGSDLVERLATASSILSNAAIRLKGSTPDYRGRLDAVVKCATDLPSS
jgi:hypothetical protein